MCKKTSAERCHSVQIIHMHIVPLLHRHQEDKRQFVGKDSVQIHLLCSMQLHYPYVNHVQEYYLHCYMWELVVVRCHPVSLAVESYLLLLAVGVLLHSDLRSLWTKFNDVLIHWYKENLFHCPHIKIIATIELYTTGFKN